MPRKTSHQPLLFRDYSRLSKGAFAVLSPTERSQILDNSKRRVLSRGAFLVRANESAEQFFIVLEGVLDVSRTTPRGKTIILNRIGEGDVIGEVSALGGISRTADVCCATNCVVAEMSISTFKAQLTTFPNFAAFIMKSLSLRLSQSTRKLFDIATEDVPSRVLHALRSLELRPTDSEQKLYLACERPTHAQLARMVGTSREVVGRALALLERAGEIRQDGKSVLIKVG